MSDTQKTMTLESAMLLIGVTYGVTRSELRNAYHKRMRELHPDATLKKEDRSAEITEVAEAHEFLAQHLFGRSKNQERSGRYHLYLTLPELSSGTILKRAVTSCDDCLGTGYLTPLPCSTCGGTGSVEVTHENMKNLVMCSVCHGTGEIKRPCRSCHQGQMVFTNLKIDKASKPGDTIKAGVFIVTLALKTDNKQKALGAKQGGSGGGAYAINGDNIVMTHQVPYTTMVLGGKISIDLPSGGIQSIEVPEFCQSGKKLRIKNGGVNGTAGRGDMIVTLIPKTPTADQASNFFVKLALKLLKKNGL